jgi:hypothetical protein
MRVTAETITDDQIRELRETQSPITGNVAYACTVALGEDGYEGDLISPEGIVERIKAARARCADAWNARSFNERNERLMFGCTTVAIDENLAGKAPRDIAMIAMSILSDAQEFIHCREHEGPGWTVADRDANTIRQFINVAKYVIDKAVPR